MTTTKLFPCIYVGPRRFALGYGMTGETHPHICGLWLFYTHDVEAFDEPFALRRDDLWFPPFNADPAK